ncbi:hypothetical protein MPDQ_004389 [Monascus purpureus]|uniref:Ribosomal RNA-processing protein 15 n=1 Tax=Monascus purpureus TaxID=5098 RepID=A0A507QHF9_MONPU|nr:hypothetical protein MPDQ_004389 [Monascus purpureus]BDD58694.1 hypothetical protein MAP00_003953 [Monascus purpureus]
MAPSAIPKKRKVLDSLQGKTAHPKKKFRKQLEYHSSSDDEEETDFQAVNLADSDEENEQPALQKKAKTLGSRKPKESEHDDADSETSDDNADDESNSEASSDSDDGSHSDSSMATSNRSRQRNVSKRNDPTAFSTSISKILSTKLPTSARADPVLSRSKAAAQVSTDFANEKIERLARARLRAEKKEELDRGRIRDVMGIERGQAGEVAEEEKRLRKIAQRGVVKLFNAVRAAQVRGEEAAKAEKKKGTIGLDERAKAANEISKQGFLELIGGKKGKEISIEEA